MNRMSIDLDAARARALCYTIIAIFTRSEEKATKRTSAWHTVYVFVHKRVRVVRWCSFFLIFSLWRMSPSNQLTHKFNAWRAYILLLLCEWGILFFACSLCWTIGLHCIVCVYMRFVWINMNRQRWKAN